MQNISMTHIIAGVGAIFIFSGIVSEIIKAIFYRKKFQNIFTTLCIIISTTLGLITYIR